MLPFSFNFLFFSLKEVRAGAAANATEPATKFLMVVLLSDTLLN